MVSNFVLDLETIQNVALFDAFPGLVEYDVVVVMRNRDILYFLTSSRRRFDMEERLGKKCTTYVDVKSSHESICEV